MDITIASIYSALQEPTIIAALVFGFIFIYLVWSYDVKKRQAGNTEATCPAGFGSGTRKSKDVKDAPVEKENIDEKDKKKQKKDRRFTLEELKNYKYKYLAVKGVVFDVSKNEMYNKGETYSVFTGFDASRALAKMSLEVADVDNTNISDLSLSEMDTLDEWYAKFQQKYDRVGTVIFPEGAKR